MRIGQVIALDRDNQRARVRVVGEEEDTFATYSPYGPHQPWPLCQAFLTDGTVPHILAPIGYRRQVVHDDFMNAESAFDGVALVTQNRGDSAWIIDDTASWASRPLQATSLSRECGAVRIREGTPSGVAVADFVYFLKTSGGCAISQLPVWTTFRFLMDSADAAAYGTSSFGLTSMQINAANVGGTVTLSTASGGINMPTVYLTFDTWFTVDLIAAEGFGAAWVDGDGPWLVSGAPLSDPFHVQFYLESDFQALDYFHLEYFTMHKVTSVSEP